MPNVLTLELPDPAPRGDALGNDLPLQGVTVLAVEDSRFASDALRLMCRKLGARLRRADSLAAAANHLKLYRPEVVIVDLGLPDGRGETLIRDLAAQSGLAVLGMSGDAGGRAASLAAGADGFVDKPLESLAALRQALMRLLPGRAAAGMGDDAVPVPDALALRDDLAHAVALIEGSAGPNAYVAGFVRGVARHAHDPVLAAALPEDLCKLLQDRLKGPDHAFDRRI